MLLPIGLCEPLGGHLGADGGAHRQKERQREQRVEIFRPLRYLEIAIEHDVRRSAEPALDQVHEQEGEVVEDIAGRDEIAELDGVEQHRPAVDQDDVAEMQIAMDTTDEATPAALDQQRMNAPIGGATGARELFDLGCREQIGHLAKRAGVLVDIGRQRRDPGRRLDDRCMRMRHGDGAAERVGEIGVDASRRGEVIEGLRLVEAAHLDRPFDRRATAVECQSPIRVARDRHDAAIDIRRIGAVDLELGRAGGLALVEGGKIQEGKAHRALDLEHTLVAQEQHRRVSVDALYLAAATGRGAGEKGKDRLLRLDGLVHPLP